MYSTLRWFVITVVAFIHCQADAFAHGRCQTCCCPCSCFQYSVGGTVVSSAPKPALPSVELSALPQFVLDAKGQYVAITPGDVAASKKALVAAVKSVERSLGSDKNGLKEALAWDILQEQLAADEPDLRQLNTVLSNFHENKAGLERSTLLDARTKLRAYMNALLFTTLPDGKAAYDEQLDKLSKLLKDYAKSPTDEGALAIGRSLGWLNRFGQAPEVVGVVQHHYWQPNLFAEVSETLAATGFADNVDQVQPVTDNILGTAIRATTHTVGTIGLSFAEDRNAASLRVQLLGTANSDSVGRNGPVTIYSTGITSINASARIRFRDTGVSADCSTADCSTKNHIHCIAAKSNLIRKVAQNQASKKKCEAEAIASSHAETRVERQMDSQVAEMVAEANTSYRDKLRNPLIRRGALPAEFHLSTTTERLHLAAVQANSYQLGATTAPPALTGDHDLSVRVHESSIANLAEVALGGVTLTDVRMAEIAKELTGEVPPELQPGPDNEPWSITFATEQPVVLNFADGKLSVAISGRRFTRSDQEIRSAVTISATYKLKQTNTGSKLTRQGDVEVEFTNNPGQLSVTQVAFKTFLRKKFESLFKEEAVSDGLKLPGRFEKVGALKLVQMASENDWLTLGWDMPKAATVAAK